MDDDDKELAKLIVKVSFGALFLIASLIIGIWFVSNLLDHSSVALWNDLETKGTEHSYAYVQSKKELLISLEQDYKQLETQKQLYPSNSSNIDAQERAIINRMNLESNMINKSEVPDEVRQFLNAH